MESLFFMEQRLIKLVVPVSPSMAIDRLIYYPTRQRISFSEMYQEICVLSDIKIK